MIIDLKKFIVKERPFWAELEKILDKLEEDAGMRMELEQLNRFHYLYRRASADLARIMTFSSEQKITRYVESLVGRAFGEIHETREKPHRFVPLHWFFNTFPNTFRRYIRQFLLSLTIMAAGLAFGGTAIFIDPDAREILMPFPQLLADPSERVKKEETRGDDNRIQESAITFSSYLMTHNTRVAIFTLALGMTWGIGTVILLFSNGAMLGAVAVDYLLAGEAKFLAGWLLPHGSVEIPAILLAGQAGLMLAGAIIGWGGPGTLKIRLRKISNDIVTLIFGVAVMLVWAGFIEAFLSQYHEPVVPYEIKIGFGIFQLILLFLFFGKSGKISIRDKNCKGSGPEVHGLPG